MDFACTRMHSYRSDMYEKEEHCGYLHKLNVNSDSRISQPAMENKVVKIGLLSGYRDLDEELRARPRKLIKIVAVPSMVIRHESLDSESFENYVTKELRVLYDCYVSKLCAEGDKSISSYLATDLFLVEGLIQKMIEIELKHSASLLQFTVCPDRGHCAQSDKVCY